MYFFQLELFDPILAELEAEDAPRYVLRRNPERTEQIRNAHSPYAKPRRKAEVGSIRKQERMIVSLRGPFLLGRIRCICKGSFWVGI